MAMDDVLVRALIAGCGVAAIAGPLGSFVVWRRMAFFGDTLAHSALLGAAVGTVSGFGGNAGIVVVGVVVAVLLVTFRRDRRLAGDTALGILSHGSLALGLVALAIIGKEEVDIPALLFGDIMSVTPSDIAWIYGVGAAVGGVLIWLWRPLLASTVDEELATVEGVPVDAVGFAYMIMLVAVVALSMKVVGVLLVTALLIIPAAAARLLARSPERMAALASVTGCLAVACGLSGSLAFDAPSGPSIVVAALALFALAMFVFRPVR